MEQIDFLLKYVKNKKDWPLHIFCKDGAKQITCPECGDSHSVTYWRHWEYKKDRKDWVNLGIVQ